MADGFWLRTGDGRQYPVTGALRIGRGSESEILLADDLVSRLHARVWLEGERLLVRDEGSSNGTFVNNRALKPGEAYRLRAGDSLRIGGTAFTVAAGPAGAPAAPGLGAAAPASGPELPPATTRIDNAAIRPGAAAPAATGQGAKRSRNVLVGGCALLALIIFCSGLGFLGATSGRPALSTALAQMGGAPTPRPGSASATPGLGTAIPATAAATAVTAGAEAAQVLSTSPALAPLAPADYAATGHNLAADLAALNTAQLAFIRDANAGHPAPGLDEDLRAVAASAFKVGRDGETLSWATAAQDGASDNAGKMASLYTNLACAGYAQAIDAQNLRGSLAAGGQPDLAAAAAAVADYGARAWNPSVTDPAVSGNPFLPHLAAGDTVPIPAPVPAAGVAAISSATGAAAGPLIWLDAPTATLTRTIRLPVGAPLADPQDPALLATLITPAGQADAATAQQAAEAGLLRLGATRQQPAGRHSSGILADLWQPMAKDNQDTLQTNVFVALLTSDTPAADAFLAFGNSIALAEKAGPPSSGGANIVNTLFGLDQNNQPSKQAQIPVGAEAQAVSLTISNLTISSVTQRDKSSNSSFEADVVYGFDVQWTTSLAALHFTLDCVSSNPFEVTTASGTQHINAKGALILSPGAEDAYCNASSNGNTLGTASVRFLVGDPAGATQRAEKVETDSAALNLTLTAEAGGTSTAQAQAATETAAVLGTQNALETEQAASQTAEFRATFAQAEANTATAQAGGVFTLNGTFNLTQSDSGCQFSDAPSTSGTLMLSVNFNTGQASGSLQGGGGGARDLSCAANESTGTMNWQQTYSASFAGTIDATGALNLTGTLNGSNNVSWSGCTHQGDSVDCPAGYAHGYNFPVTFTGTVDKASGSGKGTWDVSPIVLPTSGDWSAAR